MKLDHLIAILLALAALTGTVGAGMVPKLFAGPSRGEIVLAIISGVLTIVFLVGTVVAAMNVRLDVARLWWMIGAAFSGLAFAICILGFLRAPDVRPPSVVASSGPETAVPVLVPVPTAAVGGDITSARAIREELEREQLADLKTRRAREAAEEMAKDAAALEGDRQRNIAASNAAVATVDRLRAEYIAGHDNLTPALLAGTEAIPDEWTNARLRQLGVPYIYRGNTNGSWTLEPVAEKGPR
jgi:hypothetical protein